MIVSLDLILVIIERMQPSVPFRTRQGKAVSPMVLWLKPRKSRSSPELNPENDIKTEILNRRFGGFYFYIIQKNTHKHVGVCINVPDFHGSFCFVSFSVFALLGCKEQRIAILCVSVFYAIRLNLHILFLSNH